MTSRSSGRDCHGSRQSPSWDRPPAAASAPAPAGYWERRPGGRQPQSRTSTHLQIIAGRDLQVGHLQIIVTREFASHALELEGRAGFILREIDILDPFLPRLQETLNIILGRGASRAATV